MLQTFKRRPDWHASGWQLHFAGSMMEDDPNAARFAAGLAAEAAGYPVFFHINASRESLHSLYQRASIYWHATGYGTAADVKPEQQEHFGMTTVEAMSAGATPIVIDTGGPREIVSHGVNGFVWSDPESLAHLTNRVITEPGLRERMGHAAMASSAAYTRAAFCSNVERVVDRIVDTMDDRQVK